MTRLNLNDYPAPNPDDSRTHGFIKPYIVLPEGFTVTPPAERDLPSPQEIDVFSKKERLEAHHDATVDSASSFKAMDRSDKSYFGEGEQIVYNSNGVPRIAVPTLEKHPVTGTTIYRPNTPPFTGTSQMPLVVRPAEKPHLSSGTRAGRKVKKHTEHAKEKTDSWFGVAREIEITSYDMLKFGNIGLSDRLKADQKRLKDEEEEFRGDRERLKTRGYIRVVKVYDNEEDNKLEQGLVDRKSTPDKRTDSGLLLFDDEGNYQGPTVLSSVDSRRVTPTKSYRQLTYLQKMNLYLQQDLEPWEIRNAHSQMRLYSKSANRGQKYLEIQQAGGHDHKPRAAKPWTWHKLATNALHNNKTGHHGHDSYNPYPKGKGPTPHDIKYSLAWPAPDPNTVTKPSLSLMTSEEMVEEANDGRGFVESLGNQYVDRINQLIDHYEPGNNWQGLLDYAEQHKDSDALPPQVYRYLLILAENLRRQAESSSQPQPNQNSWPAPDPNTVAQPITPTNSRSRAGRPAPSGRTHPQRASSSPEASPASDPVAKAADAAKAMLDPVRQAQTPTAAPENRPDEVLTPEELGYQNARNEFLATNPNEEVRRQLDQLVKTDASSTQVSLAVKRFRFSGMLTPELAAALEALAKLREAEGN